MDKAHSKAVREKLDYLRELLQSRRLLLIVELGDPGVEADELNCVFYQSGKDKYLVEVIQGITEVLTHEWILERESRLSDEDILILQGELPDRNGQDGNELP